jgi:hypothetical protein
MKTCGDIEKRLENLRYVFNQALIDDNFDLQDAYANQISILEWVLDLDKEEETDESKEISE